MNYGVVSWSDLLLFVPPCLCMRKRFSHEGSETQREQEVRCNGIAWAVTVIFRGLGHGHQATSTIASSLNRPVELRGDSTMTVEQRKRMNE